MLKTTNVFSIIITLFVLLPLLLLTLRLGMFFQHIMFSMNFYQHFLILNYENIVTFILTYIINFYKYLQNVTNKKMYLLIGLREYRTVKPMSHPLVWLFSYSLSHIQCSIYNKESYFSIQNMFLSVLG